ncbi:hypothetical protein KPH14_001327 [Odynerus spinipes]|uniref:Uncharacterized protein n=1 Tax=Odynerus spinipes TaxID=1348599 RepID=A0AAD9RED9_9HYME|nr:hypothetical protein KPH14_001327 [Odynerus spinipes]
MAGTNEAQTLSYILSPTDSSSLLHPLSNLETTSESINIIPKLSNINSKGIAVSVSYLTENNERKNSDGSIKNCEITLQNTISYSTFACYSMPVNRKNLKSQTSVATRSDDNHCFEFKKANTQCFRSISSPQLTTKPLTRSKVYRKASLKSSASKLSSQSGNATFTSNIQTIKTSKNDKCMLSTVPNYRKTPDQCHINKSDACGKVNENDYSIANSKIKWNIEDIHITCNPLSTPYPYSTPCQKTASGTVTESQDEEPKSRSCGSFLPILSLIPQTVIGFQYLSPKMKFSWWRNKIS